MWHSIKKKNDLKSGTKLIVKHIQIINLIIYKVEILALCLCSFCMSMFRSSNSAANAQVFMWL